MTESRKAPDETDIEMLRNVMLATGLSEEAVAILMVNDDDLDALCDAALSEFAVPSKKVATSEA